MGHRVDVVIPCHNRCDLTEITIRNVLLAEEIDLTVYAVDDGSSDKTLDLLNSFDDPRLHVHRFEKPRGACAARNYGFNQGEAPFVCFLDSDDLLHPQKLSRQANLLQQQPERDFAVCQMGHFTENPNDCELLWNTFGGADPKTRFLMHDAVWGMHAPLWRRTALAQVAASRTKPMVLDETLPLAQDYELHTRALCLGLNPVLTSELLCFCRRHSGPSIGGEKSVKRYETLMQVFQSLSPLCSDAKGAMIGNYWWIAMLAAVQGQTKTMRHALSLADGPPFSFKSLCELACLSRRHRFYALARAESLNHGHDPDIRDAWYLKHRVEDEPGLKKFAMPPGSF
ncbi:MAG: glycosyltransferase family A protein [Fimbriimonadaceae bacterium]